jgi:hypothetical protein
MRYIDPDLNYCPQCDEEYREDFKTCATCNISLITGTERDVLEEAAKNKLAARSMDISPDDELTTIKKGTLNEMKQLQAVLGAATIPSLLTGDGSNCGPSCGGNMYLQIKTSDGDDATEVLAEEFEKTTCLSSHDLSNAHAVIDTGVSKSQCPGCGSRFSTSSSTCPDCGLCF